MRISDLEIRYFRGIRSGTVHFDKFTVLIGANNSGKTTIIEALALLLGRDRLVRNLTEHDFFGSDPQPDHRITIIATIIDFMPNDPDQQHDWMRLGRGVSKWRDVDTAEIKPLQTKPTDQLACQIAFSARFDKENLEVETIRYFYDDTGRDDPFDEQANIAQVPITLIKELGFFLVPANRTWDRMISFSSELFRRAVAYVGGAPAEAVLAERDRLRSPRISLEDDPGLQALVGEINRDIETLFGRPSQLKLRLTTTDSDGVLDAVMPHFAEGNTIPLPSRRHGNGLISLQTLILLMRFGNLRIANEEAFLMAIEEPELHVPPPLQRKLLHLMLSLPTQAIITTHSPTVAAVPEPHQLVLVVNRDGQMQARPLLANPLAHDASSPERGLFLSDRDATVAAVMHPCVLVPEGKTDANWLRLLAQIADLSHIGGSGTANPTFTHEVGVVPTKDARVSEVFQHLNAVHPNVTCLVDGDSAGQAYIVNLCQLPIPPKSIIRWPSDWAIEHIVCWITAADISIFSDPDLAAAGVPTSLAEVLAALQTPTLLKTNEITHALIADAISHSELCMRRVRHVLDVLGNVASGRDPGATNVTSQLAGNGVSTIWAFNDAVPGL